MPRKPKPAPATEPEVLNQDTVQTDEAQAARVADANARIEKTLGDHVAEAQGRPQHIPWQHAIGSSVLLLTEGQPPRKAVIRNITDQGAFAHYDLNLGGDGGTVDGVEAWRIGRDLDAEGELAGLRERLALEERHRERGREMAQKHFEMEAEDRKLTEVRDGHRVSMRALAAKLAEHVRTDPGQMDLRDIVGEGESRGEKMAGDPDESEDVLAEEGAEITADRLRTLLHYDPDTGAFRWLVQHGRQKVGDPAGCTSDQRGGARTEIRVDGKRYKASRLAWLYVTGEWPEGLIDHINGVPSDDRIANLREVTPSGNQHNQRRLPASNTSGTMGVSWDEKRKKWVAQIAVNGERHHLGRFATIEEAEAAYRAGKQRLHVAAPEPLGDAEPAPSGKDAAAGG